MQHEQILFQDYTLTTVNQWMIISQSNGIINAVFTGYRIYSPTCRNAEIRMAQ